MRITPLAFNSLKEAYKKQFDSIRREFAVTVEDTALEVVEHYTKITRTWKNKPRFRLRMLRTTGFIVAWIQPRAGKAAKIWGYVEQGTKPHIIRPRTAPFLQFRTGYSPRTAPIARFNVGTGKATGRVVRTKLVFHPGNKGRHFTTVKLSTLRPSFAARVAIAIRRGVQRAT